MSISAEVEAVIGRYAAALAPHDREPFVQEVCSELANVAVIGPGLVARVVRDIQAKYIDQRVVGTGPRSAPTPKYARPDWGVERLCGKRRARPQE